MDPIVRNLRFEIDGTIQKHWHGGRRSVSTFFDNLSVFFPAGERFFVKSIRAHQDQLKDEDLLKDVRLFCAQEGIHGREHEHYNELLQRNGYPIKELEGQVQRVLDGVSKRIPMRMQLAVTCALEHFTALMGSMLLGDSKLLDGAHPAMAALWRWHAAEENEHKNVAFDVYRAVGGTYVERATAMVGATLIFWALVIEHQVRMMKTDGTALSGAEWKALYRFLFVDPGGMGPLIKSYFEYFRPGFHPSHLDSTPLLEEWRKEYDASPVYERSAKAARTMGRPSAAGAQV